MLTAQLAKAGASEPLFSSFLNPELHRFLYIRIVACTYVCIFSVRVGCKPIQILNVKVSLCALPVAILFNHSCARSVHQSFWRPRRLCDTFQLHNTLTMPTLKQRHTEHTAIQTRRRLSHGVSSSTFFGQHHPVHFAISLLEKINTARQSHHYNCCAAPAQRSLTAQ